LENAHFINLAEAVIRGEINGIEVLVQLGQDINESNIQSDTAVLLSAEHNQAEAIK